MKIRSVKANNRRKAFEVKTHSRTLSFPYIKAEPRPTAEDPVETAGVDKELAREAFVYVLRSGSEGIIHIDQVLEYNQDPGYLRDLLLYRLTLEAQKRVVESDRRLFCPGRSPGPSKYRVRRTVTIDVSLQ